MIPNLDDSVVTLGEFLNYTQPQVFERFAGLPNASIIKPKLRKPDPEIELDYTSIAINGSRVKSRVLLVAHVDTVWKEGATEPHLDNGVFISGNKHRAKNEDGEVCLMGAGIGADDRAGCSILWHLRELGHSLLIVGGEESGCLGSNYLMGNEARAEWVNSHNFAIEFDRAGRQDLVYYDVGSNKFRKYCETETNYKYAQGSSTDIRQLCETMCGVNISVGYKNEHTPNEMLNVRQWYKTLSIANKWLNKTDIPRFEQD